MFKFVLKVVSISFFLSCIVEAKVYKCVENGSTIFSQLPCAEDVTAGEYEVKVVNTSLSRPLPEKIEQKEPVNTMDAGDAIVIRSDQCTKNTKRSGTVYEGIIENISNYSTYSATLEVTFNFRTNDKSYRKWDSKSKFYKLKPGQSQSFYFVSRISPDSFEMQCSAKTSVKFIDSTVKK